MMHRCTDATTHRRSVATLRATATTPLSIIRCEEGEGKEFTRFGGKEKRNTHSLKTIHPHFINELQPLVIRF